MSTTVFTVPHVWNGILPELKTLYMSTYMEAMVLSRYTGFCGLPGSMLTDFQVSRLLEKPLAPATRLPAASMPFDLSLVNGILPVSSLTESIPTMTFRSSLPNARSG